LKYSCRIELVVRHTSQGHCLDKSTSAKLSEETRISASA
jgi:hypothetical protein